ncbi:MAG: cation-translocating P-type ATPase [Actinomycetota bacterium]|nr:cation-translocating P-type ATPase [Actinomycetota bacterium]
METWHTKEVSEAILSFNTSGVTGLSAAEAKKRLGEDGPNSFREAETISPISLFFSQFNDFMIWVLIVAAIIAGLFLKEMVDAAAIFVILILNAALGFIQEFRAERAMEALKRMTAPTARVLRGGLESVIAAEDLVAGDIILLEAGDSVPADARIMDCAVFYVDEASLTGESLPEAKAAARLADEGLALGNRRNMIYMGTSVKSGRARAIVVATGHSTEVGKIAESILSPNEKTPLQIELKKVGKTIALICLFICSIVFATGALGGKDPSLMFLTAVSLAVAAIPEGLPAIVTVSLALGVQSMARNNALVRRLHAVETLGSTSIICTDKTGTLTLNKMTVRPIYISNRLIQLDEPLAESYPNELSDDLRALFITAALCNDARLSGKDLIGEPTEAALLKAAMDFGLDKALLEKRMKRVNEIPFDSDRKEMTTLHKSDDAFPFAKGFEFISLTKGAPEAVIAQSKAVLIEGSIQELSDATRGELLSANESLAAQGYRMMAVAFKGARNKDEKDLESDLIFSGLLGLLDPPRKEVYAAIDTCKKANIRVMMITGDHKLTAESIAKEIGLLEGGQTLTGRELDEIGDDELSDLVSRISVYSRVAPLHKVRIVDALRNKGYIVAMTGDGVNDAPAIKRADIGISMGIVGTDVTKEASDMVLADDNFATIVGAVREGRLIFDNIRKFIHFLLSCNISEVLTMFIAMVAWGRLALLPVQILWMNLITDGLPAMALGVSKPEDGLMTRPPRSREDGILSGIALKKTLQQGLLLTACALSIFWLGLFRLGLPLDRIQTMTFSSLVAIQLFHALSYGSEKSILSRDAFKNMFLLGAIGGSFVLQLLIVYSPPLSKIFKTTPLLGSDWLYVAASVALTAGALDLFKRYGREGL